MERPVTGAHQASSVGRSASPLAGMRKLTITAIATATFVAGVVAGFVVSRRLIDARIFAYELASTELMSNYVAITRFMGKPEVYESALHDLIKTIEVREQSKSTGFLSPRALSVEKAFTYGRLALLASDRNDSDAAAK